MAFKDTSQDLVKKLVRVSRVSKTVKGGRRLSFSALVVVGDQKGRVGYGKGKANVVATAVKKATDKAKKSMISVPLREGRTIHHDITGKAGAGHVIMRTAIPGTGIIAGGAARAVFESLGIKDVICKSLGTTNAGNLLRATFNALSNCSSPQAIATLRSLKTKDLVLQREV